MGIQYEHNSSYNRCDYYVAQTREKDSKKAHGVSLDNTFLRMVFPLGLNSPYSLMSLLSKITTKTIVVYQPADNVAFSMMNSVMAADTYFPTTYKVSYIFSDNNSRHGLPNTKRTRRTDCGVSEGVIVFKRDRCASHIGRVKRIYTVFLLTGTCISDSHSLSSSLFQTPSI